MTASVTVVAQVILGGLFHLLQDHGRYFGGRIALVAHLDPGVAVVGLDDLEGGDGDVFFDRFRIELAADQAFDRIEGVLRVGDRLALGLLSHQALPAV